MCSALAGSCNNRRVIKLHVRAFFQALIATGYIFISVDTITADVMGTAIHSIHDHDYSMQSVTSTILTASYSLT